MVMECGGRPPSPVRDHVMITGVMIMDRAAGVGGAGGSGSEVAGRVAVAVGLRRAPPGVAGRVGRGLRSGWLWSWGCGGRPRGSRGGWAGGCAADGCGPGVAGRVAEGSLSLPRKRHSEDIQ